MYIGFECKEEGIFLGQLGHTYIIGHWVIKQYTGSCEIFMEVDTVGKLVIVFYNVGLYSHSAGFCPRRVLLLIYFLLLL
jgi:hypothetical protein